MSKLVIGYPLGVPYRGKPELLSFYDRFLDLITDNVNLEELVILCRKEKLTAIKERLTFLKVRGVNVEFMESNLQDLWLRDFMPIQYTNKLVLYQYRPHYYKDSEMKYADIEHSIAKRFLEIKGLPYEESDIVLDGGNHTLAGSRLVITNQVYKNNSKSKEEINNFFLTCGVKTIVEIEVEPGDYTGHTDGSFRYVNDNLLYTSYEGSVEYTKSITGSFKHKKPILSKYTDLTIVDRVPGCVGNSMNFLQIGDTVFLPSYGNASIDSSNTETFTELGLRTVLVECTALSKLGGVLNCITWEY